MIYLQYCWDQGGYLAEITSAEEEALIDTFLIDGTSFWLGLTDLGHEGKIYIYKIINVFYATSRHISVAGKPLRGGVY